MPKQRFTTAEAEAIRVELAAGADRHEVAERWDASVSTIDRIAARINPYDQNEEASHAMIPVFEASSVARSELLCNARDLHAFLQVGRDFSTWFTDRANQYGFEEGTDFVTCSPNLVSENLCSPDLGSKGRGGHNRIDYCNDPLKTCTGHNSHRSM